MRWACQFRTCPFTLPGFSFTRTHRVEEEGEDEDEEAAGVWEDEDRGGA